MTFWRSLHVQPGISPYKRQELAVILVASDHQMSIENSAEDVYEPVPKSFKHSTSAKLLMEKVVYPI